MRKITLKNVPPVEVPPNSCITVENGNGTSDNFKVLMSGVNMLWIEYPTEPKCLLREAAEKADRYLNRKEKSRAGWKSRRELRNV